MAEEKPEVRAEKEALQKEMAEVQAKVERFIQRTGIHPEELEVSVVVSPQVQARREYAPLKIHEYVSPFNYANVSLSQVHGHWPHGTELVRDEGSITIEEEEPIIRVSVIGSACTPPGYVLLEIPDMGKKLQSVENLTGSHDLSNASWCRENTAFFEVERNTKRVTLRGGSRTPTNNHYAFRIIRIEVEA